MIRISFLGDISLNDDYCALYAAGAKPFSDVGEWLEKSDYVVGNLECMATGDVGENWEKKPRLKTNVDTLNFLKDFRLNLALLANNHIYDQLIDGFSKTIQFLQNNAIDSCGASMKCGIEEKILIKEISGKKFAFLNYVTGDTHLNMPSNSGIWVNEYNVEKILTDITFCREHCDYIIVMPHWGGRLEGGLLPDKYLFSDSRAFIDAGADLVIGHHSHILQPYEKYKGKYILYCLGNFCFSDIVFEGKRIPILNKKGYADSAIAEIYFDNENISMNLIPLKNEKLTIRIKNQFPLRYQINKLFFVLFKHFPFWHLYFYWHTRGRKFLYEMKMWMRGMRNDL